MKDIVQVKSKNKLNTETDDKEGEEEKDKEKKVKKRVSIREGVEGSGMMMQKDKKYEMK